MYLAFRKIIGPIQISRETKQASPVIPYLSTTNVSNKLGRITPYYCTQLFTYGYEITDYRTVLLLVSNSFLFQQNIISTSYIIDHCFSPVYKTILLGTSWYISIYRSANNGKLIFPQTSGMTRQIPGFMYLNG